MGEWETGVRERESRSLMKKRHRLTKSSLSSFELCAVPFLSPSPPFLPLHTFPPTHTHAYCRNLK